jgi:phosphate-selective porin OprO/OprP
MRPILFRVALLLPLLSPLARALQASPTQAGPRSNAEAKPAADDGVRVSWKDGLRFESADKRYKVRVGGRIHYDTWFSTPDSDTKAAVESGTTRIEDGSEFRRARLEFSGEVGDRVEWQSSFDFAGGQTNFRGVFVGVKDLFFGNVRGGQFKEPYGLEQITSSNYMPFMERSLMNAFVPAFNAGFMVFDQAANDRMTWAFGAFRSGSDNGEISKGDGEWALTGRLTGLPVCSEDGRDYVHLGLSVSHRNPTADSQTFSSKPEANIAPAYVTTTIQADDVELAGVELGWTRGPFTLSGEYTLARVDAPSGGSSDPDFNGYYVQANYVLTGESRAYSKATGAFGAVRPAENAFSPDGGRGAWEIGARYSAIDLRDDGTDGGQLADMTLGLNWYLNANTRVMLNYILAKLDPAAAAADGTTGIFEFRLQLFY